MFCIIDQWLGSLKNFNLFVGATTLIALILVIIMFVLSKKKGHGERSSGLINKAGSIAFIVYVMLNTFMIGEKLVHYSQIFTLNLVIALLVATVYSVVKYFQFLK